ncbi:hypothetical protein M8J75_012154 [Diaphorina citri]|nr:hypothetical protein M8J75_012154 [Diaphorina citri]
MLKNEILSIQLFSSSTTSSISYTYSSFKTDIIRWTQSEGISCLFNHEGNVFVIAAILLEKNLQSVANYLIVSLAVADLMVACLVMPLGAVYEVRTTLL